MGWQFEIFHYYPDKGKYPVSISYYVNVAINTKKDTAEVYYRNYSDRLSYFHQLIIARKVTDKLSVQVAPSISHQSQVNGYFVKLNDSTLKVKPEMKFDHFAIAFSARYKLTEVLSAMVNYDQPITKHVSNNPNPSLSFGLEYLSARFIWNFSYLLWKFILQTISILSETLVLVIPKSLQLNWKLNTKPKTSYAAAVPNWTLDFGIYFNLPTIDLGGGGVAKVPFHVKLSVTI